MKKYQKLSVAALFLLGLVLGAVIPLFAQDPLEVGADIYSLKFENERVRVMEINFAPGAKIAMHSHPDHMVYVLTDGKLVLTHPDGTTADFEAKAGDVVWINAESHSAENVGTTEVKGVVIEFKEPAPAHEVLEVP